MKNWRKMISADDGEQNCGLDQQQLLSDLTTKCRFFEQELNTPLQEYLKVEHDA